MRRNKSSSAAEAALREKLGHLEVTRTSLTGLQGAAQGVAEAVTMLRQVRGTGDPLQIGRAEQARADATEVFSMANVVSTTVWLERTSWEAAQAHQETLAHGTRLNRATWVLAGFTAVLVLATLGLIWATLGV